jgi:hypothetical protein
MNREEELARLYDNYADWKLIELANAPAELTDEALAALQAEFKHRNLEWPAKKVVPITAEAAAARYGSMSNHDLLNEAQRYDALSETEQSALRNEFDSRGLEPPVIEEDDAHSGEEARADPPVNSSAADQYVTVRTYRDLPEALVARSVLEEADIPCQIPDEQTIGVNWAYSNLLGGLRLQVPESLAQQAEAILSQPVLPSFATDVGEYTQPECPRCGSFEVIADDLDRKIKAATMPVGGLPVLVALPSLALLEEGAWKCQSCGCRWTDDAEQAAEASSPAV